ncbi:malto-oligosyltrehalose synthase [Microbacterium sp. cx-55]|uniref:malto-oligosyltrehalose synthase n=1 Tax=Microbacterium sp. cx-55 TaxID=2875948 RepID=UPI001CBAF1CF|nr:malto-oligosyltrehalose synthase [Microbacterium sp. cx-55]MBZ4487569.1 malto-oligosyltrehalose synthase [Microbacterium sp. cx-55]UGB35588.1 malto-oligosyltrehalose synthase [Microbacterium sp. cx-55]
MRPLSTYRLQIRPSFDLDAATEVVPYLRDLGVSWAYLSPLLQATTGSDHGYDVVDTSRVDPARGGAAGLAAFSAAAHEAGLPVLVDIVPNHMGISAPRENPWWWDVLRLGRGSAHAAAFDIDWDAGGGRVLVPVLGAPLEEVASDLTLDTAPADDAPDGLLRYFEHAFPLAPGSLDGIDPGAVGAPLEVLGRQHYTLAFWRTEATDLNYRRFFAVTTLAGVRVELPEIFEATHTEILRWVREGLVDGLRIDHPDGLRDPGGYLDQLAEASGRVYTLVEKILEHGESLPSWWATDGTTGYDALGVIDRVLVDPAGEGALDRLDAQLREGTGVAPGQSWTDLIHTTKRMIADTIQVAEIRRLVRLLPHPIDDAEDALAEILASFPVYRSYLPAGREQLTVALADAAARRPDLAGAIAALEPVLADPSEEAAQRFQQTTGPVMAKGVEDTAFYRFTRLGSLTEVGGDPAVFAIPVETFHDEQMRRQAAWPAAMTALSTHDTKRGEDVRARLDVLAEIPERWAEVLGELRAVASTGHGPFDSLLWQAVVGAWPAASDRLHAYAEKAAREAAEATGWWDQDAEFEARMHALVDAAHGPARPILESFVAEIQAAGWSNGLAAKVLQLAGPGVPDVYQGSELWEQSLVDPDNRRPVDFALRAELLAEIDAGIASGDLPAIDESGAAKLLVTSRTLRLRRDRPELFDRYTPVTVTGAAAQHAVAFDRGGAIAVATRLPVGLAERGGWDDTIALLPAGQWRDAFTGRRVTGGAFALTDLLQRYPVALLTRES